VFARQRTTLPPTWGIAISSAGVAIVTHLETSAVSVLSVASGAVLGTIPVGNAPTSATFGPGGATAYVANQFSNSISIIDVASRTVSGTIDLPTNPYTVMMSRDGARLFVGFNTGGIGVVNLASRAVEKTIALSGNINGLAIDSTGTRLYASSMFGGEVHQIDLTTLSWLRTYTIGGVTQDIALGPNGKRLLVANEGGFITDLQLATGNMVHTIAAGGAFGMVSRPLFEKAIMTIPGLGGQQNYIMLGKVIKPMIAVGGQPRRVAVHGPSGALAITNVFGWVDFVR
jgi:YVTN family beta-propeller protein